MTQYSDSIYYEFIAAVGISRGKSSGVNSRSSEGSAGWLGTPTRWLQVGTCDPQQFIQCLTC